jgi:EmrB/QacA subfamily drug resistance transporter
MKRSDRQWLILGAMVFALFMVMLDMTVITVALPSIGRSLNASEQSLEWTVNAFSLALASLTLLGGKLGDRFGRRRLFLLGLAIFTVSSAACALSQTDAELVASRAVQGVGGALMGPLSLSIIVAAFPKARLPMALGIWAGASAFGLAIGPLVGGVLVDRAGWASVFWINVPIGLLAILVSWIVVPESSDPTTRALDLPGTALATAGLFSFVWGLIDTSSHDWGSSDVLVRLALGAGLVVAFFVWEARTAEPMLPLGFFRSLRFSAANAVMLALGFALLGTIYFLTLFMQNVQGYSAIETGVRSLPLTTMIVVVAPLSGRFSARFGPRLFVVAGLLLCALAIYGLSLLDARSPYSAIWPYLVVFGVGAALAMPVLAATVVADVDEAKAGVASGVLNTARQLGTALGVAVLGSIGATVARNDWTSFAAGLPAVIQARAQALAPFVVVGQGSSIGTLAGQLLGPQAATLASSHALDAFCHGMQQAFVAGAAVAVAAAGLAVVGLPSRGRHRTDSLAARVSHNEPAL